MKKLVLSILLIVCFNLVKAQRPNLQMRALTGMNLYTAQFKNQELPGGISIGYLGGFGFRVTKKKVMGQIDFSFIRSGIPIDLSRVGQGIDRSNIRVSAFELPIVAGYKFVDNAFFKWFLYGGINTLIVTKVQDNSLGINAKSLVNPQFGLRGGSGIDFAFFTINLNYTYGLNKLIKESSRSNSHFFEFNIGVLF